MNWYLKAFNQYADFSGRAQRSEFWYFSLIYWVIVMVGMAVDFGIGLFNQVVGLGLVSGLASLVHFVPSLSVSVRRLHDRGLSGWWLLAMVLPFAFFVFLVIFCLDSQPGPNRFGPNPKGAGAPGGASDEAEMLERLNRLRDQYEAGVINEEQFERARRQIIDGGR